MAKTNVQPENAAINEVVRKIVAIRAFDESFAITFDAPVEGLTVTKRDALGNIVETECGEKETISINAKHLRMMLYDGDTRIAIIRGARETPFESRHIVAFLLGAEVTVTSQFHVAGEVADDFVYEHDRFTYNLSNFRFSKEADALIVAAFAKMYNADDLFK